MKAEYYNYYGITFFVSFKRILVIHLQAYRDDEKNCQKLYSNPDMFFDTWKEEFIQKMEEERKKRRKEQKEKKRNRQKTQDTHKREKKEVEEIIPLWVMILASKT